MSVEALRSLLAEQHYGILSGHFLEYIVDLTGWKK